MFRSISVVTVALSAVVTLSACHSRSGEASNTADSLAAHHPALPKFRRDPEHRAHVKKEAVAEYKVRTANTLNELYFTVSLYETSETMKYLAKIDFEGLTGEDTIKIPDVGTLPHPVLQKGPEKYSCIAGFLDNDKNFRELKKVYVTDKGQELKITTLKHYMVTEDYHLVGQ